MSPQEAERTAETYYYYVDDVLYEYGEPLVTGAVIKAKLPNLQPGYTLVLEGRGKSPDQTIGDTTEVRLSRERKEAPRLFLRPPATFGR